MRRFKDLSEREVLALAIALEEQDGRIYADFADGLREAYPATAGSLDRMREEESGHRQRLLDLYRARFGDHIPLIRPQDIRGFVDRPPVWLVRPLGLGVVKSTTALMESDTRRFYLKAAERSSDVNTRKLFGDLADEELKHENLAVELEAEQKATGVDRSEAEARHRRFVLQIVQPGLAGLMDGSVSTLAPLFAAAFATHDNWDTFRVGLAASLGAGISMGFAEALSDDGELTGRGRPLIRGVACGLMTTAGGIFHTLPYVIPAGSDPRHAFLVATTIAIVIVVLELVAISWIRNRYMDTPFLSAAFQVIVGGILVFATGILIGSS